MLSNNRKGRITASKVGAFLGLDGAFSSPKACKKILVKEMLGHDIPYFTNKAMQHGTRNEIEAVRQYAMANPHYVLDCIDDEQKFFEYSDWLGATPDGLVNEDGMIEVKCPLTQVYSAPTENYIAQMQIQMLCADRAWCDFVVMIDGAITITRVDRDERMIDSMLIDLMNIHSACRDIADDMDKADEFLNSERDDAEWLFLSNQYLEAKNSADHYAVIANDLKDKLVALADGKPCTGGGIQLIVAERKGAIKYSEALKALCPTADLTPWTGESTTVISIKKQGK